MNRTRKYVIIPTTELPNIDFSQVLETAPSTCRFSVDGMQTFVKYEGEMPDSILAVEIKSQEYTYDEIYNILETEEWNTQLYN